MCLVVKFPLLYAYTERERHRLRKLAVSCFHIDQSPCHYLSRNVAETISFLISIVISQPFSGYKSQLSICDILYDTKCCPTDHVKAHHGISSNGGWICNLSLCVTHVLLGGHFPLFLWLALCVSIYATGHEPFHVCII